MQDENSSDLRPQLYERFRQALARPVGERFFDEDELIDIFDYAGDISDDYVRAEVLFCAARLYPDSDELLVRRSLFYCDTLDDESYRGFVRDNADKGESIIWKIGKLYADPPEVRDRSGALTEILASRDFFEDEEIIRLVKLADDLSEFNWVKDNMGLLRSKVRYLPVLLYEVGSTLYRTSSFGEAIPYFEELARLDPFESSYWAMLFYMHGALGNEAEAREAFDFACGLEIADPETATVLGAGVTERFADLRPAAIEKLEAASALSPDYSRLTEVLASLYCAEGRMADASSLARAYFARNKGSRSAVNLAIELGLDCDMDLFSEYLHAWNGGEYTRQEVAAIMMILFEGKRWKDARNVGATYSFYSENQPDHLQALYTEACFRLGEYEDCLEYYYSLQTPAGMLAAAPGGPTLLGFYYRSLLALGRKEEARGFALEIGLEAIRVEDSLDEAGRMLVRGLLASIEPPEG